MKFNEFKTGVEFNENKLKPTIPNNIHNQVSDNQDAGNVKDLSIIDIVCHYLEKDEIITRWDK